MTVRMTTTVAWPPVSEIFALSFGGEPIPLILIAIMTFILITSSGTMAMAVRFGYQRNRKATAILLVVTAIFGASFVGMQAFEWTKLIVEEGVRPWGNPFGAAQFGSVFFMITGFPHPLRGSHSLRRRSQRGRRLHREEGRSGEVLHPRARFRGTLRPKGLVFMSDYAELVAQGNRGPSPSHTQERHQTTNHSSRFWLFRR